MWPLLRLWIDSKNALRVVCVIAVTGWALTVGMFVLIVVVATYRAAILHFFFLPPVLTAAILAWVTVAAANIVLMFPRCARCSRLLFDDGRRGLNGQIAPDIRHHRAKTLLNSYRSGAILDLAVSGRMSCSRCGHELGTKPDYVVVAPE